MKIDSVKNLGYALFHPASDKLEISNATRVALGIFSFLLIIPLVFVGISALIHRITKKSEIDATTAKTNAVSRQALPMDERTQKCFGEVERCVRKPDITRDVDIPFVEIQRKYGTLCFIRALAHVKPKNENEISYILTAYVSIYKDRSGYKSQPFGILLEVIEEIMNYKESSIRRVRSELIDIYFHLKTLTNPPEYTPLLAKEIRSKLLELPQKTREQLHNKIWALTDLSSNKRDELIYQEGRLWALEELLKIHSKVPIDDVEELITCLSFFTIHPEVREKAIKDMSTVYLNILKRNPPPSPTQKTVLERKFFFEFGKHMQDFSAVLGAFFKEELQKLKAVNPTLSEPLLKTLDTR